MDPKVLELIELLAQGRRLPPAAILRDLQSRPDIQGKIPPLYTIQRIVKTLAYRDESAAWQFDPLADPAESRYLLELVHLSQGGQSLTVGEAKWAAAIHAMSGTMRPERVLGQARRYRKLELEEADRQEADGLLVRLMALDEALEAVRNDPTITQRELDILDGKQPSPTPRRRRKSKGAAR